MNKDIKEDKAEVTATERMLLNRILIGRLDAAELLSVSVRTIDHLVSAGKLRPKRCGSRVLFARSELETFARKLGNERP